MSAAVKSPYVVPSFNPGRQRPEPIERYFWWSWHPLYPYWSKSCWGAATKQDAIALFDSPYAPKYSTHTVAESLDVYHNKLIRENDDGTLTEIADRPCQRLDVWQRIFEQQKAKANS